MRSKRLVTTVAVCAAVVTSGSAGAAMMHPTLGAHLAGMGETGVVNLTLNATKGQVCWTFDLPAKGLTGASIRDGSGMSVASLGSMYSAKGCGAATKTAIDAIETKPGSYRVWVATKGHPSDLQGTLFAGMASMTKSHM